MLVRYGADRAKAKARVLQDEQELHELWESIKLSSFEALLDVKREMDKFRTIQLLEQELQVPTPFTLHPIPYTLHPIPYTPRRPKP